MGADVVVLAHLGGVPEAMTVAVPVAVVVAFVLAERRVRRRERDAIGQAEVDAPLDCSRAPDVPTPGA